MAASTSSSKDLDQQDSDTRKSGTKIVKQLPKVSGLSKDK